MPASTSAAPAIAGTAFGETNAATSMWRTPASISASTSAIRSATETGASGCSPSRGPTSRIVTASGSEPSYRRHAVATIGEVTVLADGQREAPDQLGPQVARARRPHRCTSSEARRSTSTSSSYIRRCSATKRLALVGVLDRLDLVGEHRVDRRLGTHHRDLGGRQGDASPRARTPDRTSRTGRRRTPCARSTQILGTVASETAVTILAPWRMMPWRLDLACRS